MYSILNAVPHRVKVKDVAQATAETQGKKYSGQKRGNIHQMKYHKSTGKEKS